ncbi:hypothetical protein HZH68_003280 [Vespula germanica]|nr:hypothetical protein HZH68_003280 [Vespula germanica]
MGGEQGVEGEKETEVQKFRSNKSPNARSGQWECSAERAFKRELLFSSRALRQKGSLKRIGSFLTRYFPPFGIETKFTGSSCNDLVTSDGAGSTIISGHFDQRIRFWDTRAESSSNDILLEGKVTSLDLSRDTNYLLSCVRDDTVKLIDLRMKKIIGSFSADGFKVAFDWTRAAFSPDGQYIAAGSSDGSVFIWSVATHMVENVLKNHA